LKEELEEDKYNIPEANRVQKLRTVLRWGRISCYIRHLAKQSLKEHVKKDHFLEGLLFLVAGGQKRKNSLGKGERYQRIGHGRARKRRETTKDVPEPLRISPREKASIRKDGS